MQSVNPRVVLAALCLLAWTGAVRAQLPAVRGRAPPAPPPVRDLPAPEQPVVTGQPGPPQPPVPGGAQPPAAPVTATAGRQTPAGQIGALRAAALQLRRAAALSTPYGLTVEQQRLASDYTYWLNESARDTQSLADRWQQALQPPAATGGAPLSAEDEARRQLAVSGGFKTQLGQLQRRLATERKRFEPLAGPLRAKHAAGSAALSLLP